MLCTMLSTYTKTQVGDSVHGHDSPHIMSPSDTMTPWNSANMGLPRIHAVDGMLGA